MNIIEHLTRTVTPILLNNSTDANRSSLLEKLYAILVARFADGHVYNGFASATIADNDTGFFDRLLPDASHRTTLVQELSKHYSVPEQETQSLVSRAAPLVLRELRTLAGNTPVNTFLGSHLSSVASVIPAWAYTFIPASVLGLMNINAAGAAPVVKTTTRTEEHLVATPKEDNGGLMKTLLPIIGLLILGALAWALLKSCNKTEPVATPVVASAPASTTDVTASSSTATVVASTVTIDTNTNTVASMPTASVAAVNTTDTLTTISTTEPSVVFENGRLSFYFVTGKADVAGNAKEKANQGKDIANNMIEGYKELNQNISQTINLISDIESASKEQLLGIEQINSAVNQLDQQTQQNAAIATQTQDVAKITDEIAKLVIENANAKEFDGKNSVKGRNLNISSSNYNSNVAVSRKTSTVFNKKVEKTIVAKTQEVDDWETF